MDRDVNAFGQDDARAAFRWRSREVERKRALELSGVLDAVQHPAHGRHASLRNTLAICIVALAVVAVMVTAGLMRQDSSLFGGSTVRVVPESEDAPNASVAAEPSGEITTEVTESLEPGALQNNTNTSLVEANRANCDAIRGTPYASETERTWFLATCVIEPEPAGFLAAPGTIGLVPEPAPEPAPVEGFSADDAIASAAGWIASQPFAAYEVDGEDCNATGLGETWLVTCRTTLLGCNFAKCETWQSVCVTDANRAILEIKNC